MAVLSEELTENALSRSNLLVVSLRSPSLACLYARPPDQNRHATQAILPFSYAFLALFFPFCWVFSKLQVHYGGKSFWESFYAARAGSWD